MTTEELKLNLIDRVDEGKLTKDNIKNLISRLNTKQIKSFFSYLNDENETDDEDSTKIERKNSLSNEVDYTQLKPFRSYFATLEECLCNPEEL